MLFTMFTDQGCREYNEDSYGMETHGDSTCFVLADGLGGHGGGDVASKTAVSTVCSIFKSEGYSDSFFDKVYSAAHDAIIAEQEKANNYNGMKTTLVVLVISGGYAYYAHAGDSRLYFLKDGRIKARTYDHSVPQMLVLSKSIKESEIRNHPDRSKLLKVLGVKGESPKGDVADPVKLSGNISFLLCSDGYWELIKDKDIETTNRAAVDTDEWLDTLSVMVRTAGENKNMDNYTAIAVWIDDGDTAIEKREEIRKRGLFKVEFEEPGKWDSHNRKEKKRIKLLRAKAAEESDTVEQDSQGSETICDEPVESDTEVIDSDEEHTTIE